MKRVRPGAGTPRSSAMYWLLVYALSIPFWALSALVDLKGLPDNLPLTDVGATFVPLGAALMLTYREEREGGIRRLLAKAVDFWKIRKKAWYAPILLLMPALYALTYAIMRLVGLPIPHAWRIPPSTPLIFIGFLVAAAGEELGYMGYLIDPLQLRMSALSASVVVGCLWALWHVPSMIRIGQGPRLIAWGLVATVGFRILYVWLYNNTDRCVSGVIVLHAIGNTGRSVFPGGRTAFELADAAIGYSMIAIAAATVTLLWGAQTLASGSWKRSAHGEAGSYHR